MRLVIVVAWERWRGPIRGKHFASSGEALPGFFPSYHTVSIFGVVPIERVFSAASTSSALGEGQTPAKAHIQATGTE
jgi:hypothetical protein